MYLVKYQLEDAEISVSHQTLGQAYDFVEESRRNVRTHDHKIYRLMEVDQDDLNALVEDREHFKWIVDSNGAREAAVKFNQ